MKAPELVRAEALFQAARRNTHRRTARVAESATATLRVRPVEGEVASLSIASRPPGWRTWRQRGPSATRFLREVDDELCCRRPSPKLGNTLLLGPGLRALRPPNVELLLSEASHSATAA